MNLFKKWAYHAPITLMMLFISLQLAFLQGRATPSTGSSLPGGNYPQLVSVSDIPDSLLQGAHAVVQHYSKKYVISSESSMKMEVRKTITILNSAGDMHGYFYVSYDASSSIQGFKASVYDKNNEEVLKYRKRDLRDFGLSPLINGVTDARVMVLEVEYPDYPYTVEIEYKKSFKNLFDIQDWQAVENREESVLKTELTVENKSGIPLRHRLYNMDKATHHQVTQKDNVLYARIENLPAFPEEDFSQPLPELSPLIKLALTTFSYDGYEGKLSSWKDLGNWIYSLSEGRNNLPDEVCAELQKRAYGLSVKERVEMVYKYMQERSRYVSIQLGLGGWQPFETAVVHEKGYGDCKALSFYTKSLLQCVGVDAKYTLVYAGSDRARIDEAFPANQFNHVILCIPDQADTVWLECTAMNQPFNYLGTFTHDRKALIVEEGSSQLVETPELSASDNIRKNRGDFQLNSSGDISGKLETSYAGLRYDEAQAIMMDQEKERINDFYQSLDFGGCSVQSYDISKMNNDAQGPTAVRQVEFTVNGLGKRSGKRMFLKPNVANMSSSINAGVGNRVSDVVVEVPKYDVDSISYALPAGIAFEYVPAKASFKTMFGTYKREIYANDSVLTYVRKLKKPAGRYPAEKYTAFTEFINSVAKADQQSVVIIVKE